MWTRWNDVNVQQFVGGQLPNSHEIVSTSPAGELEKSSPSRQLQFYIFTLGSVELVINCATAETRNLQSTMQNVQSFHSRIAHSMGELSFWGIAYIRLFTS